MISRRQGWAWSMFQSSFAKYPMLAHHEGAGDESEKEWQPESMGESRKGRGAQSRAGARRVWGVDARGESCSVCGDGAPRAWPSPACFIQPVLRLHIC